jgi:EAL domain-containing protein (putative c-di-GMP-specific phosphodiesterase class I)/CheY-like chemotaxis protein
VASSPKLIVIDDNADVGDYICDVARDKGWECITTTDAVGFLEQLTPDVRLVFLDLLIPGVDGIELLRLLAAQQCGSGIVLMSGVGKRVLETAGEMAQVSGLSVVGYLEKPFQLAELERMLDQQVKAAVRKVGPARPILAFLDSELIAALDDNQLLLHYQPQVEIRTGDVVGLEALVRWLHPQRGLICPDDFIPRMEILGLIDRLGYYVARQAIDQVRSLELPMISINVSVRALYDLSFPDALEDLARTFGFPLSRITVEITESGLVTQVAQSLDVLTRLRMKGIQLSIDDFGTGYSMMQQLRQIPATELKIDRSFIQRLHLTHGDRIVVRKTIELGHDLGMRVVAEGVETEEQLDFLRANDCDIAQGYLISRPLPFDHLCYWMSTYKTGVSEPENWQSRLGAEVN